MCVLCGDLAGEAHWTERNMRSTTEEGSGNEVRRRQARFRRTRVVNRILGVYGLSIHQDLSGTQFVVADAKGAQELARDLDQVWLAADRLAHTTLDPLDHRLLDRLEC